MTTARGESRTGLSGRIDLAIDWLKNNIIVEDGFAGWGWVPDVPPNPQNTAEAVYAFAVANVPVPHPQLVINTLCRNSVDVSHNRRWDFASTLDMAWRLRALLLLGRPEHSEQIGEHSAGILHKQIDECSAAILHEQNEGGGWPITAGSKQSSITATCTSLLAYAEYEKPSSIIAESADHGLKFVLDFTVQYDYDELPLFAAAQIAVLLSHPRMSSAADRRQKRALKIAVRAIHRSLDAGSIQVEEEPFQRGEVKDTWRHLTTHTTTLALAVAEGAQMLTPNYRNIMQELLELQELIPDHGSRGGFRTSKEGFVTSYATTQAITSMCAAQESFNERINPAAAYALLSHHHGAHHTDPQNVGELRDKQLIMNSTAGFATLAISLIGFSITLLLALLPGVEIDINRKKIFLGAASIPLMAGLYLAVASRVKGFQNGRIAFTLFGALVTAIVLPILFGLGA